MSKFIHLFENISELDNSYTSYTLADSSKKLHETFLSSLGSEVESKDECIRQIFINHPFFSVHCTDGDLLWRKYNDYLTVLGDNVLVSCDYFLMVKWSFQIILFAFAVNVFIIANLCHSFVCQKH